MQIRPIEVVGGSPRYAPFWNDAAYYIMENAGSGALGTEQARAGDVTCLYLVGGRTYTLPGFAGGNAIREGNQAIQCHSTNAPERLMLGAWHDTPLVGEFGKVQGSGWDHDVQVDVQTAASDTGLSCLAQNADFAVIPTADLANDEEDFFGPLCVLTELAANMTDATTGQHSVFWRAM